MPWAGAHQAPPGQSAGGAAPRASRPAHPSQRAAMSAGSGRCRQNPPALQRARAGLSSARVSAAARRAPASVRTRPSPGNPQPHATTPHPVSCPTDDPHLHTPTGSRGATSGPLGTSGGISHGSTCHPLAWANTAASVRAARSVRANAGAHLLPEAGATQARRLEAVRCSAWFGAGLPRRSALASPLLQAAFLDASTTLQSRVR
jgi:hypothetical protein